MKILTTAFALALAMALAAPSAPAAQTGDSSDEAVKAMHTFTGASAPEPVKYEFREPRVVATGTTVLSPATYYYRFRACEEFTQWDVKGAMEKGYCEAGNLQFANAYVF